MTVELALFRNGIERQESHTLDAPPLARPPIFSSCGPSRLREGLFLFTFLARRFGAYRRRGVELVVRHALVELHGIRE